MKDYLFVEPWELAQKLAAGIYNQSIGFTNDTEEDMLVNGEPTGWYGIQISDLYDGDCLLIGYYGAGIVYSQNLNMDISVDNIVSAIQEFWNNEFGRKADQICVDKKEYEEV